MRTSNRSESLQRSELGLSGAEWLYVCCTCNRTLTVDYPVAAILRIDKALRASHPSRRIKDLPILVDWLV